MSWSDWFFGTLIALATLAFILFVFGILFFWIKGDVFPVERVALDNVCKTIYNDTAAKYINVEQGKLKCGLLFPIKEGVEET